MSRQILMVAMSMLAIISSTHLALAQQDLTADDIVKNLSKKPLTRGLKTAPMSLDQMNTLSKISRTTRGISIEQRSELSAIVSDSKLAALDFEINFAFDSDKLDARSLPILNQIGIALSSKVLNESSLVVAGHTDATGRREYNQDLSERRAMTVKQFLIQNFSIDPRRLIVAGYGQEMLKTPSRPYADENRRVQIINLGVVGKPANSQNLFNNGEQNIATNVEQKTVTATAQPAPKSEAPMDPLAPLDGTWISVNPPGPQVLFYRVAFGQRAASLSFGTAQIRLSDGTAGSNIKVSGEGFDCFYSVGFTGTTEMIWQNKQGGPLCPMSAEYRRAVE